MTKHYALDLNASIAELKSDAQNGLTVEEAARRLDEYGPNELQEAPRQAAWVRFLHQFNDLIVIVLIAAAAVSAIVHDLKDTIAIGVIVVINGVLGFVQEERAERALAALKRLASPRARVIRGGQHMEIESPEVVPGDIVEIDTGDFIPADVRIIEAANLQIEEAALTGESVPVNKDPALVLGDKTPSATDATWPTWARLRRTGAGARWSWRRACRPKSAGSRACCRASPSNARRCKSGSKAWANF